MDKQDELVAVIRRELERQADAKHGYYDEDAFGDLYDGNLSAEEMAAAVRSYMGSAVLPCDVTVAPATVFRAGVKVSTLLDCIEDRRSALGTDMGGGRG